MFHTYLQDHHGAPAVSGDGWNECQEQEPVTVRRQAKQVTKSKKLKFMGPGRHLTRITHTSKGAKILRVRVAI